MRDVLISEIHAHNNLLGVLDREDWYVQPAPDDIQPVWKFTLSADKEHAQPGS